MLRMLLALAALLGAQPALAQIVTADQAAQTVAQVRCWSQSSTANRVARGSGFYINGAAVTASHVLKTDSCDADGRSLKVTEIKRDVDVAIVSPRGNKPHASANVSCAAFQPNETYVAMGYVDGRLRQASLRMTGNRVTPDAYDNFPPTALNTYEFDGLSAGDQTIQGMSGGPVFDKNWQIVGIVVATAIDSTTSYIRSVTETSLCQSSIASR